MSEKPKIGDKVRFLSDVGGGIVSGFQAGGLVLVEDEDGFQMPVPQNEVVVIDTNEYNFKKRESFVKKPTHPVTTKDDTAPAQSASAGPAAKPQPIKGTDYLASKTATPQFEDTEEAPATDEQLEAKVTRLEMQIQKLELRLLALENKAYRRRQPNYQPHKPSTNP